MLKQTQIQTQTLKLSPQQILLMKMIEMPGIRLEQEVLQEIEENLALEVDYDESENPDNDSDYDDRADDSSDDYDDVKEADLDFADREEIMENYYDSDDDYRDDYENFNINTSKDDKVTERVVVSGETFQENLLEQIALRDISDKDRQIAEYIIGNIDNSGYLLRETRALVNDLILVCNISATAEDVERVITEYIHELDPPGIGARNLRECLLIQLRHQEPTDYTDLAILILDKYFDEFSKKHYTKILKHLNISEEELKEVLDEIQKLDPRPGNVQLQAESASAYLIPDFYVRTNGDKLELSLNNSFIPKLKISKDFQEQYTYYSKNKQQQAATFVKQNIDNANAFIVSLNQREVTLYKTMKAIMDIQERYFFTGNDADLKPMILKDIADKIEMDVSTVSRVSNSKYVQTFFGTIPLKHFFSESLTTDGGDEVSTKEIKKMLTDLVDTEDKKKPLTDDQLCSLLNKQGYNIARRTVAKYREQLDIPIGRMRKAL